MKPFLRWVGGKRWLAPKLAPWIAAHLHSVYYEPFLGAGAVALELAEHGAMQRHFVLSDACAPLINAWIHLARDNVSQRTLAALDALIADGYDQEQYLAVRRAYNENIGLLGTNQAARFLYLNAAGFNGVYRTNAKGHYNVPYGGDGKRAFPFVSARVVDTFQQSPTLRNAQYVATDFATPIAFAKTGDVVFADPPYDDVFNAYTSEKFAADMQTRLRDSLRAAVDRGATVVTTNADTPRIRDLYPRSAWYLHAVNESRSVAARGASRRKTSCLLIASRPIDIGAPA